MSRQFPVKIPTTYPPTYSLFTLITMVSLLVIGLTSCASSITKQTASHQIVSANAAVSQSIVNDARTFAPLDLRTAERKLEQARIFIENKDYYMAQISGEQAEIDAQYAEAKAQSTKAENIVQQLQENNRILKDEISRATSLDTDTKAK